MKEIELNGNSTIDFPEFLTLIGRQEKACTEAGGADKELESAFKVFNRSNSGAISKEELIKFFESISLPVDEDDVRPPPSLSQSERQEEMKAETRQSAIGAVPWLACGVCASVR